MRNIEVSPEPIAGTAPIGLSSATGNAAMTAFALRQKTGIVIAVARCISDIGTAISEKPDSSQLRYFGGPKSPMWSGQ